MRSAIPSGSPARSRRGIVSSIRQVQEPDGLVHRRSHPDRAAINPGNSGGPLLNWHGEVIGINTIIASSVAKRRHRLCHPINTAKAVVNDLSRSDACAVLLWASAPSHRSRIGQ